MPEREKLYDPVSRVAPTDRPTPQINITRPRVDFSDSIGQALGEFGKGVSLLGSAQVQVGAAFAHLGGSFEQASDEIFRRASAIKSVQNDTAATEAAVKFSIEGNKMTEAYEKANGNAATGSLDAHMKSLEDTRQKIRSSLGNEQALHMFDQRSLEKLGALVNRAGHHSMTQSKVAARSAADADEKMQLNDIMLNADKPGFDFEREAQKAMERYRSTIAAIDGDFGKVRELKERELWSRLYSSYAMGLGKHDTEKAYSVLEDAKSKGRMMAPDYEKVKTSLYRDDMDNVSRNIAQRSTQTLRENKTEEARLKEPSEAQVIDEAMKELEKHPRLSKDADTRDLVDARTRYKYRAEMQLRKDEIMKADKYVQTVILGNKSPTGQRPQTKEEAIAMGGEEFKAALSKLPLKLQMFYEKKILAKDYLDSEEVQMEVAAHEGKAMSGRPGDADAVLATNYFEKPWPWKDINRMYQWQLRIMKGEHRDLALDHTMNSIEAKFGLTQFKQDKPDYWNALKSAMYNNIQTYQEKFKTYPKEEEQMRMANEWINKTIKDNRNWWGGQLPMYIPSQRWIDVQKARNKGLSEHEIMEDWRTRRSKDILENLFPGRKAVTSPAEEYIKKYGPTD